MRRINGTLDIRFINRFTVNGHDIAFYLHRISSYCDYALNKISAFRRHMKDDDLTALRRADIV
ncbi:hypothetical protein D3C81_2255160 [compost metagenome]